MGDGAEGDDDLGDPLGETLSGAQIERDAGPSPIGDLGLDRDERLRGAVGVLDLADIAGNRTIGAGTGAVLAANGERAGIGIVDRLQAAQHLQLLVAHRIRVHVRRRLHGDEAEKLHDVVLHHVAQRPGGVVVAAAALDAEAFGDGDLDVVDMGGVPQGLEQRVAEAERHQVLDRLLAEIMVDPVDLPLVEHGADGVVHLAGRLEVVADRLLDDDAGPGRHQLRRPELGADGAEEFRTDGQVEGANALLAAFQDGLEVVPARFGLGVDRDEMEALEEGLDDTAFEVARRDVLAERVPRRRTVFVVAHAPARHADDPPDRRQLAVAVALIERRQELAVGEIARAAEYDEVERLDGDDPAGHDGGGSWRFAAFCRLRSTPTRTFWAGLFVHCSRNIAQGRAFVCVARSDCGAAGRLDLGRRVAAASPASCHIAAGMACQKPQ